MTDYQTYETAAQQGIAPVAYNPSVTFEQVATGQASVDELSPDDRQLYFQQQAAGISFAPPAQAPAQIVPAYTLPQPLPGPAPLPPTAAPQPPIAQPPPISVTVTQTLPAPIADTPPGPWANLFVQGTSIGYGPQPDTYYVYAPGLDDFSPPVVPGDAVPVSLLEALVSPPGSPPVTPGPGGLPPLPIPIGVPPIIFPTGPPTPAPAPVAPIGTSPAPVTPTPSPTPTTSSTASGGDVVVQARADMGGISIHEPGITPETARAISDGLGAVEANVDVLVATGIDHVQGEISVTNQRLDGIEGTLAGITGTGVNLTQTIQGLEAQLGNDEANIRALNVWTQGEPDRITGVVGSMLGNALQPIQASISSLVTGENADASNIAALYQITQGIQRTVIDQGERIDGVAGEFDVISPEIVDLQRQVQDNAQCCNGNTIVLQPIIQANISKGGWQGLSSIVGKVGELLGVIAIIEVILALLDMDELKLAEASAITTVAPIADRAASLALGYTRTFWGTGTPA